MALPEESGYRSLVLVGQVGAQEQSVGLSLPHDFVHVNDLPDGTASDFTMSVFAHFLNGKSSYIQVFVSPWLYNVLALDYLEFVAGNFPSFFGESCRLQTKVLPSCLLVAGSNGDCVALTNSLGLIFCFYFKGLLYQETEKIARSIATEVASVTGMLMCDRLRQVEIHDSNVLLGNCHELLLVGDRPGSRISLIGSADELPGGRIFILKQTSMSFKDLDTIDAINDLTGLKLHLVKSLASWRNAASFLVTTQENVPQELYISRGLRQGLTIIALTSPADVDALDYIRCRGTFAHLNHQFEVT